MLAVGTVKPSTFFTTESRSTEAHHGIADQQRGTELHRRDDAGQDQLPRVDRQRLGHPLFAPEGLHAGLYDRAGLHGGPEAAVRQAQLQDHRAQCRPGRRSPALVQGHRRDAGPRRDVPDDRRSRAEGGQGLRHATGGVGHHLAGPHRRRQRDGALGVRDRAGQEDQGDADLSDGHGPQLRRGAAAPGFLPAHDQAQGGHAGELEARPGRDHRHLGLRRGSEEDVSRGLEGAEAVSPDRVPAEVAATHVAPVAEPAATGALPHHSDTEDAMARSRSWITRRRFVYLAASAGALAATTRASAQSRAAGLFVSAKTTEAPSLDPMLEQALSRQRLDPLFYNRLVEWGHDGKLEPGLAESWTTSADGRTWTFKLRRGVKFHNGRDLAADDVKFTYERILDPKTGSGGRGYLSAIEHIETPDKSTVRIVTKQPSASLLAGMAGGWSAIVPRDVVEKGDLRRTAVGTGPFILQEWVPQSHLKARKNPDYWDKGKPAVDAIEIKVIPDEANIIAQLRTGNIHHALLEDNKNYLLVKDDKRLRALRSPRLGLDMVNINHIRKPYTDVRVRQALSLAVDRTEVLQAAASGLGSVPGPLTPAMRPWALPAEEFKEWYTPNSDPAKKLLADAGFPNGFKTTLKVIPTFPAMVAGSQVIAAQLKKIGVDAQIIQEEYGVWIKAIIKPNFDFDLTMNATTGDADPDSLFYRRFHSVEKQWNNDGDPNIDVLLDQGRAALAPTKRKESDDKARRLRVERATQIWTFAPDMIDVTQGSVQYRQH